jgi:hypothetical protein
MKKGERIYDNGDKYIGEMKKEKMHGQGLYTFKNDEIYKGGFKNDMFHGTGVYTYQMER